MSLHSNTGYRFITLRNDGRAYKVSVPIPNDPTKKACRSIGTIKLGKDAALVKAIQVRDQLGEELWTRELWKILLKDVTLITRLPHDLTPRLITKTIYHKDGGSNDKEYYIADWCREDGSRASRLYSVEKHGKLGAFSMASKRLHRAHRDVIPFLKHMGRYSIVSYE